MMYDPVYFKLIISTIFLSGDFMVRAPDRKFRVRVPAGAAGKFLDLCQLSVLTCLGIRSTPCYRSSTVIDSAKCAGGRLQLNTHAPF